jgi:CRP-like cAMP-binding protein
MPIPQIGSKVRSEIGTLKLLEVLSGLHKLPSVQAESLGAKFSLFQVKRRHGVHEPGANSPEHLYLLVSGSALITYLDRGERPIVASVLARGEFFGASFVLNEKTWPFNCQALTDCLFGVIESKVFCQILFGAELEAFRLKASLLGRWLDVLMLHAGRNAFGLHERLLNVLGDLALKFGVRDSRGTILNVPISREDLAAMAGGSRSKVSKCLSDFEHSGFLMRDRRRLIVRLEKLDQMR